jgi:hypothetical protein
MALVMQLVFSCDCYATHRHDKTSTTPCYVQESLPSQSIILWFSMNLVRWQLLFLMEGDLLYFFLLKIIIIIIFSNCFDFKNKKYYYNIYLNKKHLNYNHYQKLYVVGEKNAT